MGSFIAAFVPACVINALGESFIVAGVGGRGRSVLFDYEFGGRLLEDRGSVMLEVSVLYRGNDFIVTIDELSGVLRWVAGLFCQVLSVSKILLGIPVEAKVRFPHVHFPQVLVYLPLTDPRQLLSFPPSTHSLFHRLILAQRQIRGRLFHSLSATRSQERRVILPPVSGCFEQISVGGLRLR